MGMINLPIIAWAVNL